MPRSTLLLPPRIHALLHRSRQTPKSSPCPSCDAPLDVAIAAELDPTCPSCQQRLIPAQVAGHWRRVAAKLADIAILVPTAGTLDVVLLWAFGLPPLTSSQFGLDAMLDVLAAAPNAIMHRVLPFVVMSSLYFLVFWGLVGRTPGQRWLGLRVVDASGKLPTPLAATIRVVMALLGLVPGALGWVWASFDREKRTLHDHVAGTYVVRFG